MHSSLPSTTGSGDVAQVVKENTRLSGRYHDRSFLTPCFSCQSKYDVWMLLVIVYGIMSLLTSVSYILRNILHSLGNKIGKCYGVMVCLFNLFLV